MAGNKALEKFKNSKVPKKGKGTTNAEVKIYSEPNTHSKVIGAIKKYGYLVDGYNSLLELMQNNLEPQ